MDNYSSVFTFLDLKIFEACRRVILQNVPQSRYVCMEINQSHPHD